MASSTTCNVYENANEQRSIPTCVPISRDASECYIQDSHSNGPAPFSHWLEAPRDLILIGVHK